MSSFTVFVLFWDFSSVVLLALLLKRGGGVEQDLEIEYAYFLVGDVLVNFVLALVGNGDSDVWMEDEVLLMMLMRS